MAEEDYIAPALRPEQGEMYAEGKRKRTLGNVRLRHLETDEVILVPSPTSDPNDPLNWPQWYKHAIAVIVCLAMMWCNFLAAGPTIAIVRTALDFFPDADETTSRARFQDAIASVAYFFTSTALLQGTGNFVWVPLANKYGRRPVYLASYTIYLACAIWLVFEKSYAPFLAGRILMGFGSGAAETIAPLTIADIYFLHERGTIMAFYSAFLSIGVAFGIIIAGLVTISHSWRVIYEVAAAVIGFVLLLAFFCFPETAYPRDTVETVERSQRSLADPSKDDRSAHAVPKSEQAVSTVRRHTYWQSLRVFRGVLTRESFLKMVFRPLGLICLPPVLWAALVQAVTIGFMVAVTSNVDSAYQDVYGLQPWQVGLCFVSAIVGTLLGIPAGGLLGDKVADMFTKRNGGIRDPEMRLPAMMLSLFTTPAALILYGVGIHRQLHWICPTIGLGLLHFSIAQATNICLVYVIDAYRPVTGEVTLAVMGFKSMFGFLLSFYTNPWINKDGYARSYCTMAAIAFLIILFWLPLYLWGRHIRRVTWHWPVISYIHWSDDREVGE